jgi:hypothetical protein
MIKKLAVILLASAASMAAADFSGIWNGVGAVQSAKYPSGVPYTVQLTLLQGGSSLNGTLKVGSWAPSKITVGSVSGTQVTFAIQGSSGQITAQLTPSGNNLVGSMTLTNGLIYNVVFTKQ